MALNKYGSLEEAQLESKAPEVERIVLGSLLTVSNEETATALASLSGEVFTDPENRAIYATIASLSKENKPIDEMSVYRALCDKYGSNYISPDTLLELSGEALGKDIQYNTNILLDKYLRRRTIERAYKMIGTASDQTNDIAEILSKEKEELSYSENLSGSKFYHLLNTPTAEEYRALFKEEKGGIDTDYIFSDNSGNIERLTLPSGAITIIGAPTSHGKSSLLQNLALETLQRTTEEKGVVLYFTFEEKLQRVYAQFVNKHIGGALSTNNRKSLIYFLSTGSDKMIRTEQRENFRKGLTDFEKSYIDNKRLRLYNISIDAMELIEFIRYASTKVNVRGVFIDYIQKLHTEGYKDNIMMVKYICDSFNTLANKVDFPIVMGAQLNRQTTSPVNMYAQNIAEASYVEQVADTIILLWNGKFNARGAESAKDLKELAERGLTLGGSGKIYMKIEKNRGGTPNIDGIFNFEGNTGLVTTESSILSAMDSKERLEAEANGLDMESKTIVPF